ncbi:MAG: hypothetical protein ACHQF3_01090 [Alphaproteobacteria bacterium]
MVTAVATRERPALRVCDDGAEPAGMAILQWPPETQVERHYIAPG